jgi:ABC-type nitrate/sulfonate/bicarbonate transport system substrate-binding protein
VIDRMSQHTRRTLVALAAVASVPALVGAGATTEPPDSSVIADEWFTEERCAANQEAGTITYLTGFDFAAAASMVDVFVAEEAGYFDELCLDVEVVASFSTANYPLIAANEAQFASGGSFSEVINFDAANDADLVAVVVEGRFPIDALILKPDTAETLDDLAGTTIGVKGAITPAVEAMLAGAGLVEGDGYATVLLDGFDPIAHIAIDEIVGFPGYKSNEPGTLDRAGIDYDLFDPADYDVPGSFGVIYTSRQFLDEHPTAAQDFVRATMHGLADALDDPEAAAQSALDLAEAGGNPSFLSLEGESFRWQTDAELLDQSYADGEPYGVPDLELLQAEIDAYDDVGLFTEELPELTDIVDVDVAAAVYDEHAEVIWPQ